MMLSWQSRRSSDWKLAQRAGPCRCELISTSGVCGASRGSVVVAAAAARRLSVWSLARKGLPAE